MSAPLPKPTRVEKWQRWLDTSDGKNLELVMMEHSAGGTWFATRDGQCGWYGMGMLEDPEWSFLGYAKPDKVEVGQRWQRRAKGVIQIASIDGPWATTTHGERFSVALCKCTGWEYLGMLESAELGARAATGEALDREAKHNEFVRSDGDTDERLRARFSMPRDPKIEARRTNEEAAKRLIANPPGWAYPRAWTCAVLRQLERGNRAEFMEREFSPGFCFYEELRMYHANRLSGQTHDMAKSRMNMHELCDAYARGMEKPAGLMGRPGVKGGISTCDLGGEYE